MSMTSLRKSRGSRNHRPYGLYGGWGTLLRSSFRQLSIGLTGLFLFTALAAGGADPRDVRSEDRKLIVFDMDGTFLMAGFNDLGTNQTLYRDGKNEIEYHTAPFLFETLMELRGEGKLSELRGRQVDIAIYTASSTGRQAVQQILHPEDPAVNLFDFVRGRIVEGSANLTLREGVNLIQRKKGESIFKYYFKNLMKFADGTLRGLMGRIYRQENIVMVEDINTVGPGQSKHLVMVDPVFIASRRFESSLIGTVATEEAGALAIVAPQNFGDWFQSTFRLAAIAPMVNEALILLKNQEEKRPKSRETFQQIMRRLSLQDRTRFIKQGLRLYGLSERYPEINRILQHKSQRPAICFKSQSIEL